MKLHDGVLRFTCLPVSLDSELSLCPDQRWTWAWNRSMNLKAISSDSNQWLRRWWWISGAHWTQARHYMIGEIDKKHFDLWWAKTVTFCLLILLLQTVVVYLTSFDSKQVEPTLEHPQAVDLVVWWRLLVIKYSKGQRSTSERSQRQKKDLFIQLSKVSSLHN